MSTPEINDADIDPHDVETGQPPASDDEREVDLTDETRDEEILPDDPRPGDG